MTSTEITEPFTLEGFRYWRQIKTCKRPNCSSCTRGGNHGSYWYKRPISGPYRPQTYIGRRLPADVLAALEAHAALLPKMQERLAKLAAQEAAISRLINRVTLSQQDRQIIEQHGLAGALIGARAPDPELAAQVARDMPDVAEWLQECGV